MNKYGIIFDLDGTLWDSSDQVVEAWNTALRRHSELNKQITGDDMRSYMGKTMEDIAKLMLPDVDENKRIKVFEECCNEEQVYLSENGAILYPAVEEIFKILSDKYELFIVSNSQDGYVQAFVEYYGFDKYIKDIEMYGRTGKKKSENIKLVVERNGLEKAVYVGDTIIDCESAREAGIPFIHAKYGFGKIDAVEYGINSISELPEIVETIF